jgi:hypothetical protein
MAENRHKKRRFTSLRLTTRALSSQRQNPRLILASLRPDQHESFVHDVQQSKRLKLPASAFADPRWWTALLLLVLNDWWFKGSLLMPSFLTGILSDFAGLLVAPSLFAWMLGLKSSRGWLAAHLVVGGVFAGLECSPSFETWVEWSTAKIGFPWNLTADAWDLLALTSLALSWHCFVRSDSETFVRRLQSSSLLTLFWPRRALASIPAQMRTFAAAALGALACGASALAGSDSGRGSGYLSGQVFIYNNTDRSQEIALHYFRPDLQYDCSVLESAPQMLLQDELFGPAQVEFIEPETLYALSIDASAFDSRCAAAQVRLDQEVYRVFWTDRKPSVEAPFLATKFDASDIGALVLNDSEQGIVTLGDPGDLLIQRLTPSTQSDESCASVTTSTSLGWDLAIEGSMARLDAIAKGEDQCLGLDLHVLDGAAAESDVRYYLCLSPEAFPFNVGDILQFSTTSTSAPGTEGVVAALLVRPIPDDGRQVVISRGQAIAAPDGFSFAISAIDTCGFVFNQTCARSARPLQIVASLESQSATLRGEQRVAYFTRSDGTIARIEVAQLDETASTLDSCTLAAGAPRAGRNVEVVTTIDPPVQRKVHP